MATIRQYRPAYFTGFEEEAAEFETLEQLLAVPFVANAVSGPGHHRLSITEPNAFYGNASLMHELNGGRTWFKIGNITGDMSFELHKFDPVASVEKIQAFEKENGFGDPPFQDWVETV